ncbi:VCBS domain-containing protein, partial [Methylobacterium sp. E-045]
MTVTINGADDAAVVAGVATGSVTEAGGVLNGT